MTTQQHSPTNGRLGQADHEVHHAVRYAVLAAAAGLGYLITGALWDSTCTGAARSVDTVACGAPQLAILAFGGPLILMAAGIWAFVRTYRVWRSHGTWWAWQGAGWLLLILALVTVTMSAPLAAPVLTG